MSTFRLTELAESGPGPGETPAAAAQRRASATERRASLAQAAASRLEQQGSFSRDIMMQLSTQTIQELQAEFEAEDEGLSITQFCRVMTRFLRTASEPEVESVLPRDQETLVSQLVELFEQIDINGDGFMEWSEFSGFIVETGMASTMNQPDSIASYRPSGFRDTSKHAQCVEKLHYLPVLDRVAAVEHASRTLKLYDPATCELTSTVTRPEGTILCAAHLPELSQLATCSSDLQLTLYDDAAPHRLARSLHLPSSQHCMTWSGQSRTLFTAGLSGVIYGWQNAAEERLRMGGRTRDGALLEDSHSDMVLSMLHMPSLEVLASASMDTTIRLWDVATGRHKRVLQGHSKGVRSLAYSPEYRFLVSAGFDYDAAVFNPYCRNLILKLTGHNSPLAAAVMIEHTPQILTADVEGVFKLWDVRTFTCLQTFSAAVDDGGGEHDVTNTFVATGPHKRLISGGRQLHVFDYEKLANPELTDDNPISCALYNETSTTFITAAGRDVKIWDAARGGLARVYRGVTEADITALCLDDRQRKFVAADHLGNIVVCDYMAGTVMKSFSSHSSEVSALLYADDYKIIISACWDGTIAVHDESDPEAGILLRRIDGGHKHDITALAYSRNLSLIATGSSDNSLRLWDLEHSRLVASCVGHCSGITSLEFLDPYPLLCAADTTGNICLWGVRPSHLHDLCLLRWQNCIDPAANSLPAPVLMARAQCQWSRPCACAEPDDSACDGSCGRTVAGYRLITGDERGVITVWDLFPALQELAAEHVVPLRRAYRCDNATRNLRYNAADVLLKLESQPLMRGYSARAASCAFYFQEGTPKVQSSVVRPLLSWTAHTDSVFSLTIISEPPALLTASFDRLVKVWSLESGDTGTLLGTLRQGDEERRRRPWGFVVDFEARRRKKLAVARGVLSQLQEAGPAPPVVPPLALSTATAVEAPDVEEDLADDLLLPRLPAAPSAAPRRRTPRLKPVRPNNAGHGVSARAVSRAMQRRLQSR